VPPGRFQADNHRSTNANLMPTAFRAAGFLAVLVSPEKISEFDVPSFGS
jgi:hypothetical protein